jgi:hypothetical protein
VASAAAAFLMFWKMGCDSDDNHDYIGNASAVSQGNKTVCRAAATAASQHGTSSPAGDPPSQAQNPEPLTIGTLSFSAKTKPQTRIENAALCHVLSRRERLHISSSDCPVGFLFGMPLDDKIA